MAALPGWPSARARRQCPRWQRSEVGAMRKVGRAARWVVRPALVMLVVGLIVGSVGGSLVAGASLASVSGERANLVETSKDTINAILFRFTGKSLFRRGQGVVTGARDYAGTAQTERTQRLNEVDNQSFGLKNPITTPVADVEPFTNIAATFIPPFQHRGGHGPGVCIFDYDRDGKPDIFVPNPNGNALYHNEGNNVFRDVAREAGVLDEEHAGTGCVAFDYDNDGYPDIYVANRAAVKDGMDPRYDPQNARNTLFHNNRNGTFTDVTEKAGWATPACRSAPPSRTSTGMATRTCMSRTSSPRASSASG